MNKEEIEKLLIELEEYAQDIRDDWSTFDGRELLKFIQNWTWQMRENLK